MNDARRRLIAELQAAQGDMSLRKFAASIGVNFGYLSEIYSGKKELIGASILGAIRVRYKDRPALVAAVNAYQDALGAERLEETEAVV